MELMQIRRGIIQNQPHLVTVQSGNITDSETIAHFSTSLGYSIKSLVVNLPYKAGGYSAVKITHCGKNLLHITVEPYTRSGVTCTAIKNDNGVITAIRINGTTTDSNWFINLNYVANQYNVFFGRFTLSTGLLNSPIVLSRNYQGSIRTGLREQDTPEYTMTYPKSIIGAFDTAAWYRFEIWPRDTTTKTVNGVIYPMIRFPSDNGAFEPYNGIDYTVTFPTTIYGGSVELISGELISRYASDGTDITPVTYQITPQTIDTLTGVNNIWSDNGNVTIKYWTH